MMDNPAVAALYPRDVVERARKINKMFGGAVGAYTDSRGTAGVRQVRGVAAGAAKLRTARQRTRHDVHLCSSALVAG